MPRILLWVGAVLFFIWEHVALFLWLRASGGIGAALVHAWNTLRADWIVLLTLTDAGIFTLCALIWMWRDLRRREMSPRARALWFGTAAFFGTPPFLAYLASTRTRSQDAE